MKVFQFEVCVVTHECGSRAISIIIQYWYLSATLNLRISCREALLKPEAQASIFADAERGGAASCTFSV